MRDYQNCQVKVWSSTPAVLWTSHLPQEAGIHVHIYQNKVTVCLLDQGSYKQTVFTGNQLIISQIFPQLTLNTQQVLSA